MLFISWRGRSSCYTCWGLLKPRHEALLLHSVGYLQKCLISSSSISPLSSPLPPSPHYLVPNLTVTLNPILIVELPTFLWCCYHCKVAWKVLQVYPTQMEITRREIELPPARITLAYVVSHTEVQVGVRRTKRIIERLLLPIHHGWFWPAAWILLPRYWKQLLAVALYWLRLYCFCICTWTCSLAFINTQNAFF